MSDRWFTILPLPDPRTGDWGQSGMEHSYLAFSAEERAVTTADLREWHSEIAEWIQARPAGGDGSLGGGRLMEIGMTLHRSNQYNPGPLFTAAALRSLHTVCHPLRPTDLDSFHLYIVPPGHPVGAAGNAAAAPLGGWAPNKDVFYVTSLGGAHNFGADACLCQSSAAGKATQPLAFDQQTALDVAAKLGGDWTATNVPWTDHPQIGPQVFRP